MEIKNFLHPFKILDFFIEDWFISEINQSNNKVHIKIVNEKIGSELIIQLSERNDSKPCYANSSNYNINFISEEGMILSPEEEMALNCIIDLIKSND